MPMAIGLPFQAGPLADLTGILLASLNKKQLLILSEIAISTATISAIIDAISLEQSIPESTLKSNVKRLRELGLVSCGDGQPARLTGAGELVLRILNKVE